MTIVFGVTMIILMITILLICVEIIIVLKRDQRQVFAARIPPAINLAGAIARTEVDRIIARYSQEIDQVLHPKSADQPPGSQIIFIDPNEYISSMEETYVPK